MTHSPRTRASPPPSTTVWLCSTSSRASGPGAGWCRPFMRRSMPTSATATTIRSISMFKASPTASTGVMAALQGPKAAPAEAIAQGDEQMPRRGPDACRRLDLGEDNRRQSVRTPVLSHPASRRRNGWSKRAPETEPELRLSACQLPRTQTRPEVVRKTATARQPAPNIARRSLLKAIAGSPAGPMSPKAARA